ncbi:MAG: hypothetical protein A2X13_13685 [Bacteroidetes bacterium GWC2_33_15]|nr:MAG: hypothetical protein A2X10_08900 [Bacteroidetes bacterium GWA2_33_15]OFX50399.1 MAG: hypothetical protein A2X13_13685 [Bacteroidetes bacterium GWC2_33_15]OFX66683.1 MAG: hypothetical protein A2X15_08190 [Bacteroidetes bacterium GWB2_32_14]OFX69301.1 MAG: hypothetical protein A2X14_09120 [Bacteroidetes bacterium GWD2_33_33]HAN18617.1 hypothetical protein [Bacteroidales bacterium]
MNSYNPIVDKYIYGELDTDEMVAFEQLLANDSRVKKEYHLYNDINHAILEKDVMVLRGTLDGIYNEIAEPKEKYISSVFSKRKMYYAAASLAMLMATGGIVNQLAKNDMGNEAIYSKYFTPYEVAVTYRSGNEEADKLLLYALQKYEDEEYDKAVVLFEQVLEKRNNDMAANLYSGISLMETEKYQKATHSFQAIIAQNDNLFTEQAKWYLAMCYIKTNSVSKAENILNDLIVKNSYYKDIAKKVLKELD